MVILSKIDPILNTESWFIKGIIRGGSKPFSGEIEDALRGGTL
jgi:hypothetical protein